MHAMSYSAQEQNDDWLASLTSIGIKDNIPIYEDTYPNTNPIDIYRCHITYELAKITGKDPNMILPGLAWTNSFDKGDLMFAIPRLQLKGQDPATVCEKLAAEFPPSKLIHQPSTFNVSLRFDFRPELIPSLTLPLVFKQGSKYGHNSSVGLSPATKSKKRAVIEFSSPNIAKEFHVGHLRSTIIGAFLSKLYESMGWDVVRLNYLGDWGRQFGLLAVGWDKYGSEELFEQDPIRHLLDIYTAISKDFKPEEDAYDAARHAGKDTSLMEKDGLLGAAKSYVQQMEAGDKTALSLWRRFRSVSIEKYIRSYARLNVVFDEYTGESEVKQETMDEAERILRDRGVSEYNDGATIIDFKKHGAKKLDVAIIRNRNGTSSYQLRDIGSAIQRWRQYKFDHMIYVVMSEQNVHVERLFTILKLMGGEYAEISKRLQHVTFGKVKGMSTRRGTVKLLEDVLNDISESMHQVMQRNEDKYAQVTEPAKTADMLGISSLMVQDMGGKRINNYAFDLNRMLSFEGDTGPYLQYAHARLCSISRRSSFTRTQLEGANFKLLQEPHAIRIVQLIASWPDIVLHTYKTLEPATVVTFLFRLTHQVSSSYDILKVVNAPEGEQVSLARAALFDAARQVLANGFRILGLTPVERM